MTEDSSECTKNPPLVFVYVLKLWAVHSETMESIMEALYLKIAEWGASAV